MGLAVYKIVTKRIKLKQESIHAMISISQNQARSCGKYQEFFQLDFS
jgi:hypothetical protein